MAARLNMIATDQLSDEDRAILLFLETYFERHGMKGALAMLRNEETKVADLRAVIDGNRELWKRQ
jgi:hypothetical protein